MIMKKRLLHRKKITQLFFSLCLMLLCANVGWGQQLIGTFPNMDGGFEGQTSPIASAISSTSSWWLQQTGGNIVTVPTGAGARTGNKYLNDIQSNAAVRRLHSPVSITNVTAGSYTVQFYYIGDKDGTPAGSSFSSAINYNAAFVGGSTIAAPTATSYTKVAQTIALTGVDNVIYGVIRPANFVTLDIDDFVIYAGSEDTTSPDIATTAVITPASNQIALSWDAPLAGVDGGGYMVVRGTSDPSTAPNVNGIYAVGNIVTAGEQVVYLGTNPSFTDTGLATTTQYYYRIYTVDKAFNYSSALTATATTTSASYAAEPTAQVTGLNITGVSTTGMTINFTPAVSGAGTNHLVVIGTSLSGDPADGSSYIANTDFTAIGSSTVAGGKVVYNGTGNSVTVTGLTFNTNYTVRIYDFNGTGSTENYLLTSPASGNQTTERRTLTSVASGPWGTAGTWSPAAVPTLNDNVVIGNGHIVTFTGISVNACYNLNINSGGQLYNITGFPTYTIGYMGIYGTSIVVDGTFGDTTTEYVTGIQFNQNCTLSGNGTIRINRIRPYITAVNALFTFNADATLTNATGVAMMCENTGSSNIGYKIESGKTVTSLGSFTGGSSSSTNAANGCQLTVNGTLNANTAIYLNAASGKTAFLVVSGTLNVNKLYGANQATGGGAVPSIFINSSGVINTSGTGAIADFSDATTSGHVSGTGTFNLSSGSTLSVGFTDGLNNSTGPIRCTTRNFNTDANYSFTGSSAQVTGAELPTTVNNLTINNAAGVTLSNPTAITNKLTLTAGQFNTGNQLTLKSTAVKTAVVGPVLGSISGNVIVERHIPAGNRAYRLLSPATTGGTIQANWQEGGSGDPLPGFGTHITGTGGATNGFDATTSNAASLFTHNNTTPAWIAATNTSGTLTAGSPYLIYIRGSRQATNITNTLTNDGTTLRTTGVLATGTQVVSGLNTNADGFSLIGNPYQAQVDMQAVLLASTDLVTGFYYVVDPSLGTKGAYLAVDITAAATIDISKNLQPGQACFVKTVTVPAAAPTLSFNEADKSEATAQTSIFRTKNTAYSSLDLTLMDGTSKRLDVLKVAFDASETNMVNENDASKLTNFDENMASSNSGKLLAIEKRAVAVETDEIPLNITKYRGTSYIINAKGTGMTGATPYLVDAFANTITEIPQDGSIDYAYTVDSAVPATIAADRFKITYTNKTLKTIDNAVASLALYPNPSKTNSFSVVVPQGMKNASLRVSNLLGQQLYAQNNLEEGATARVNVSNVKTAGVYLVSLTSEGKTATTKWIVE